MLYRILAKYKPQLTFVGLFLAACVGLAFLIMFFGWLARPDVTGELAKYDKADLEKVNALRDIGSGLKTIVGGELKKYNEMMDKARAIATDRMVEEANSMGADAVIGFHYTTSSIMQSAAEVLAYGTAVKFK